MTTPSNAALNLHEARVRLEASVIAHHGLDMLHRFEDYLKEREMDAIFHSRLCQCVVCSDATSLVGAMNRALKP